MVKHLKVCMCGISFWKTFASIGRWCQIIVVWPEEMLDKQWDQLLFSPSSSWGHMTPLSLWLPHPKSQSLPLICYSVFISPYYECLGCCFASYLLKLERKEELFERGRVLDTFTDGYVLFQLEEYMTGDNRTPIKRTVKADIVERDIM